jgi:hypothetical protein
MNNKTPCLRLVGVKAFRYGYRQSQVTFCSRVAMLQEIFRAEDDTLERHKQ